MEHTETTIAQCAINENAQSLDFLWAVAKYFKRVAVCVSQWLFYLSSVGVIIAACICLAWSTYCVVWKKTRNEDCAETGKTILYLYYSLLFLNRFLFFHVLYRNRKSLKFKGFQKHFGQLFSESRRLSGELMLWLMTGFIIATEWPLYSYIEKSSVIGSCLTIDLLTNTLYLSVLVTLNLRVFVERSTEGVNEEEEEQDRPNGLGVAKCVGWSLWLSVISLLIYNFFLWVYDVELLTLKIYSPDQNVSYHITAIVFLFQAVVVTYRWLVTLAFWNKVTAPDRNPLISNFVSVVVDDTDTSLGYIDI